MYHPYDLVLMILSHICFVYFTFLMYLCMFSLHLGPISFGTTVFRLIEGMYHPYKIVSLTSDHTFSHTFRIFDAFLKGFTTFLPCPLWNNCYQAHWGYVPFVWHCFLVFWSHFPTYISHFWCTFACFHYIWPLSALKWLWLDSFLAPFDQSSVSKFFPNFLKAYLMHTHIGPTIFSCQLYLPLDEFILTCLSGPHLPPHHSMHLIQLTKQSVISAFLVHHCLADTPYKCACCTNSE